MKVYLVAFVTSFVLITPVVPHMAAEELFDERSHKQ